MTVSDPFYSQISLLLPFDAADGSTTFTDESPFAHTPTTSGSPVISATHSKAGNALYLNGSSNLSYATSPAFALGSQNFAIGVWFWAETQTSSYPCLIERSGTWGAGEWQIMYDHAAAPDVYSVWVNSISSSAPIMMSTTVPAVGALQHVALIRTGNELRLCVDGVTEDTYTISGNFCGAASEQLRIGNAFKGWMDAPSITKGSNRGLIGNFTPDVAFYHEERFRTGITSTINPSGDLIGYTHYAIGIESYMDLGADVGVIRRAGIDGSIDLASSVFGLYRAQATIADTLHLSGVLGASGRFLGAISSLVSVQGSMDRIGRYRGAIADTLHLIEGGASTGDLDANIDAWAINAATTAHSRYADFPFNSFAHFDGKVYGCKADGIYELGGTADGPDPIAWTVTFGETDFGSHAMKRVDYVYLGMVASGDVSIKVIPDGNEAIYSYPVVQSGRDSRSGRAQLGKGLKQRRYWQFELASDAAQIEIEAIDYEQKPISRRV